MGAWDSQDEHFGPSVLHPTQVGKNSIEEAAFGGTMPVMIAAGCNHTVVVTNIGRPWAWGRGIEGQLGSGDRAHRYLPQRVGTEEAFGNSQVIMASGGSGFTLFVTESVSRHDNESHMLPPASALRPNSSLLASFFVGSGFCFLRLAGNNSIGGSSSPSVASAFLRRIQSFYTSTVLLHKLSLFL